MENHVAVAVSDRADLLGDENPAKHQPSAWLQAMKVVAMPIRVCGRTAFDLDATSVSCRGGPCVRPPAEPDFGGDGPEPCGSESFAVRANLVFRPASIARGG